jgi:hypothetical protein
VAGLFKVVILSKGCEGIREMVAVSLPRPRDRGQCEFVEAREALLEEFNL